MMRLMRQRLYALLTEVSCARPPALRRSLTDDALLACDLPLTVAPDALAAFMQRAESDGWRVERRGDWLWLDAEVPLPPPVEALEVEGETACALSLLERHPGGVLDRRQLRRVLKAAEQGTPSLETCCAALHADWAERLRKHTPLPGELLPWLRYEAQETLKRAESGRASGKTPARIAERQERQKKT